MHILFDQGTPVPLRQSLENHVVRTAAEQGWDRLSNGDLLAAADAAGFELLLTTDKNLAYQQNLAERRIAIIVIGNAQWPVLQRYVHLVVEAVNAATPGSYAVVDIPLQ
jgi:hypothetical protein